ncbi:serine protease [Streptomyces sp. PTM05]|uniref:Serine protease n=1 Tax=Streptantibioticus parmotrematis TaxID=2873249 RepID=A0ABS7R135_9ACTN|nr:serine protease [Streptantibioticus parmotrematis]MBY8889176.1 serine protease [Streptantibioticus parmotrematis]
MALGVPRGAGRGRPDPDDSLVRIHDLAGRTRGTGFLIDTHGTLLTSHEAVDGLPRLVLHATGEQTCLADAAAVTPLPGLGLALVATDGLVAPPLPVAPYGPADLDGRVRVRAQEWTEARVVGTAPGTYTATDRFHLLPEVYALATGDVQALRPHPLVSGSPLIDATTGAVVALLATALHAERPAAAYAIPPRGTGPLAEALARNAATVPVYGPHLNLAGALHLTGTCVGAATGAGPLGERLDPVRRPDIEAHLRRFAEPADDQGPLTLALVGEPGCGRSTELAALAARRAREARPAPTVWLRGAELRPGDGGLRDAVERALRAAGRIIDAAAGTAPRGGAESVSPDAVARLARGAGRPLLVLLDAPEEMPPALAHALPDWIAGTAHWLRDADVRLVVACRPEFWEHAGRHFPPGTLHDPGTPARALPPCVLLGDLGPRQAASARARHGVPDDAVAPADAGHPLTLRLLGEVRAATPGLTGVPDRADVFAAHLDLVCLRVAGRLAPDAPPSALRRLAIRVAGQAHEAARRCLGPGQGELDREAFERIFPWRGGWASAVLGEGLLVPAGAGYRFAHEEFGDWLQGAHLDLDTALHALVHRWTTAPRPGRDTAVRLPSRPAAIAPPDGGPPPPPPAPALAPAEPPHTLPVPRHRIGPVAQSLLLTARRDGPASLAHRLHALVSALDTDAPEPARVVAHHAADPRPDAPEERRSDATWWAAHLLGEALLRVPDAEPYRGVLRRLAERITVRAVARGGFAGSEGPRVPQGLAEFGPWFWRRLPLTTATRLDLLRLLLPADPPPAPRRPGPVPREDRFIAAVDEVVREDTAAALPVLCRWFGDDRPLAAAPGARARPTVATAAQALLHTHRHHALDALAEALADAGHARADELLGALAEDEPSAVCRAVERWARDARVERRVAAAGHGLRVAPHVRTEEDRARLRGAALALLGEAGAVETGGAGAFTEAEAEPGSGPGSVDDAGDASGARGAALALLVRDPVTRNRYLPAAVARFAAGDPCVPASALAAALATHPEPVLAAFGRRLREPGPGAAEVLAALSRVTTPALARRAAALVSGYARRCPAGASHVAAYLDARLEQGPAARAVLFPLVAVLLRTPGQEVRRALTPVLTSAGTPASRPLRRELLGVLRAQETPVGH